VVFSKIRNLTVLDQMRVFQPRRCPNLVLAHGFVYNRLLIQCNAEKSRACKGFINLSRMQQIGYSTSTVKISGELSILRCFHVDIRLLSSLGQRY